MKKALLILLGILLFVVILWNLNLGEILEAMAKVNPLLFVAVLGLHIVSFVLKGIKWQWIIKAHGSFLSLWKCIKYYFVGYLIGIVTPGRVGDFSKALYFLKEKKGIGLGLATVLVDRLIDVFLLFAVTIVAVVSFAAFFGKEIISLPLLAVILIALIVLIFLFLKQNFVSFVVRPFFRFFVPQKYQKKLKIGFDDFYASLKFVFKNKKDFLLGVIFGIIAWLVVIYTGYTLGIAMGFEIPLFFFFIIIPVLGLVDIIPISISGIGTRDAVLIFLFSFYAITAEQAVAYSLLFLFSGYWFLALIGLVFFLRDSIDLNILRE